MKRDFGRLTRKNVKLARGKWAGQLSSHQLQVLRSLTENYGFAVALSKGMIAFVFIAREKVYRSKWSGLYGEATISLRTSML